MPKEHGLYRCARDVFSPLSGLARSRASGALRRTGADSQMSEDLLAVQTISCTPGRHHVCGGRACFSGQVLYAGSAPSRGRQHLSTRYRRPAVAGGVRVRRGRNGGPAPPGRLSEGGVQKKKKKKRG